MYMYEGTDKRKCYWFDKFCWILNKKLNSTCINVLAITNVPSAKCKYLFVLTHLTEFFKTFLKNVFDVQKILMQ